MSPANINHNNFWLSSKSRCCRHIVNFKRRCLWVSRVQSIECSKGPFITLWHYNHNYVVIVGPIKLLMKAYPTGKISWLYTLVKSRQIKKNKFLYQVFGLGVYLSLYLSRIIIVLIDNLLSTRERKYASGSVRSRASYFLMVPSIPWDIKTTTKWS